MDFESTDCVIMSSRGAAGNVAISPFMRRLLRFARNDTVNLVGISGCDTVYKCGMTQIW